MVQIEVTTGELEEQQQDNPLKEMVCGGHRPLLSVSLLSDCSPVLLFDSEFLSLLIMRNVINKKINMATNLLVFGYFEFS